MMNLSDLSAISHENEILSQTWGSVEQSFESASVCTYKQEMHGDYCCVLLFRLFECSKIPLFSFDEPGLLFLRCYFLQTI